MYYPKSQIKSNLYTNGGEYILSTTKEDYKGSYYEVSNGQKYTGNTPQDGANILLLPPKQNINGENHPDEGPILNTGIRYVNPELSPIPIPNNLRFIPIPNPTFPTDQEINLGVYTRYFCKKNNELKYMEIDKITFNKLNYKTKDIAWDLYTPISTLWYLRGNTGSSLVNKGLISQIEQKQKWYGFTQWFQDKF
jgi:hypothetical protein